MSARMRRSGSQIFLCILRVLLVVYLLRMARYAKPKTNASKKVMPMSPAPNGEKMKVIDDSPKKITKMYENKVKNT